MESEHPAMLSNDERVLLANAGNYNSTLPFKGEMTTNSLRGLTRMVNYRSLLLPTFPLQLPVSSLRWSKQWRRLPLKRIFISDLPSIRSPAAPSSTELWGNSREHSCSPCLPWDGHGATAAWSLDILVSQLALVHPPGGQQLSELPKCKLLSASSAQTGFLSWAVLKP
nr:uncharacterized protein LOC105875444 isoform X2 [Microcebus murinus]